MLSCFLLKLACFFETGTIYILEENYDMSAKYIIGSFPKQPQLCLKIRDPSKFPEIGAISKEFNGLYRAPLDHKWFGRPCNGDFWLRQSQGKKRHMQLFSPEIDSRDICQGMKHFWCAGMVVEGRRGWCIYIYTYICTVCLYIRYLSIYLYICKNILKKNIYICKNMYMHREISSIMDTSLFFGGFGGRGSIFP